MIERELIYMDAKSSKFWKIRQEGNSHTVTYGRIGSAGQQSAKSFDNEAAAAKDAEKLIKEKLAKGYVDQTQSQPAAEGLLPLVAFPNINQRDDVYRNAGTFIGQRVVDYDSEKAPKSDVIYRFRSDWDGKDLLPDLQHFLASPAAADCKAIVIGAWSGDDSSAPPDPVFDLLIQNSQKLPKLVALYVGDITSEENEMSWINQSDLTPLLQAFPRLQLLRTRGGEGLALTPTSHENLRGLAMETGGMNASVVRSLCNCQFPNLEYLELWLGTPDYGATTSVEDLQPLLSGKLFPKLKYLGLRNSEIVDQVAAVAVNSPLVQRLETLDLSLGVLTDEGGQSLLHLPTGSLKKLNLHYHFLSPEMVKKLKALPLTVDASNPSGMDIDEEDRFVAVGE
jgi:predicted DNA-binding WGR domain protein